MGPRLLKELAWRGLLMATPFVVWFVWRAAALRSGRPIGATPWTWLVAAGAMLVGVSLILSAVTARRDPGGQVYVPAEVDASGRIVPGHFEKAPAR